MATDTATVSTKTGHLDNNVFNYSVVARQRAAIALQRALSRGV